MIRELLLNELNRLNIDIDSDLHFEEEEDINNYSLDASIKIGSIEHYNSWIERVDRILLKKDNVKDDKLFQMLYDEVYSSDVNCFIGMDFDEREKEENKDINDEKLKHIYFYEIAERLSSLYDIIEKNSVKVKLENKDVDLGIYSSKRNTPRKTMSSK